jgi:hypothetical protein
MKSGSIIIASQRVWPLAGPMTGSAKQSIASNEEWIASSLSLLAMTAWSMIEAHLIPL